MGIPTVPKEGGNRDTGNLDQHTSLQMYWIEESERSCQEHLARYHHLQDVWQGNPRVVFQLNKYQLYLQNSRPALEVWRLRRPG